MANRNDEALRWRELAMRAWQVLDVECPNATITADLLAALNRPAPSEAMGGEDAVDEMVAFIAASEAAGYGTPQKGLRGDAFLYERDADRFAGWEMARAGQPSAHDREGE